VEVQATVSVHFDRDCKSRGEAVSEIIQSGASITPTAWYALHTKHQHEKSITAILGDKGFEVFCPTYSEVHRWKDRKKEVTLPLFPGYVFVAEGLDRRLELVSTPGVCKIVGFGNTPALVPEVEIESIRRATLSSRPLEPHPFLKAGERVRLKCGPLAGVEGILQKWKDSYRLVLSIELLGRSVSVEVQQCDILPIAS
jgi:transcription antitermination factor NusG